MLVLLNREKWEQDPFFLSIPSLLGFRDSDPQHRVSLLKICRPISQLTLWPQELLFCSCTGCCSWLLALSPLPSCTNTCVSTPGQSGFLTLALLLLREGQNPSLFCFGTAELWSPWSGLRGSACQSYLCIKAVVLFALLNPGVLSSSVWSLLLATVVIHAASNSKAQSQDREQFGNSIILRFSFVSLVPFHAMCSSVAHAYAKPHLRSICILEPMHVIQTKKLTSVWVCLRRKKEKKKKAYFKLDKVLDIFSAGWRSWHLSRCAVQAALN